MKVMWWVFARVDLTIVSSADSSVVSWAVAKDVKEVAMLAVATVDNLALKLVVMLDALSVAMKVGQMVCFLAEMTVE